MNNRTVFFPRNKAFTLIEILTAMVIIGILAGALMLIFPGKSDRATATSIINDLRVLKSASTQFYAANGTWPSSLEEISSMISKNLKLECADEICYDVALDIEGNFVGVRAELSFAKSGVRSILADLATSNGLFEDPAMRVSYSGGGTVFSPVRKLVYSVDKPPAPLPYFLGQFLTLDQYRIISGNWYLADGTLRAASTGPERQLGFGDSDWTDYTLSLTARILEGSQGNRGYGIFYRADESSGVSGYLFQVEIRDDMFSAMVVSGGASGQVLATVPIPGGVDLLQPHTVDISLSGTTHTIRVNGITVMKIDDSTYTSGSAGLKSWSNVSVEFSSIEISP